MRRIRKSIEIEAPVGEVFAYATTPQNLPEFWPSILEVSNVEQSPDGRYRFDWIYKLLGIRLRGHSETIELARDRLSVVRNETGIKSTLRYEYEPRGARTEVTVESEYELPGAVFGRLAAPLAHKMLEREAEQVLVNLKAQVERRTRAEPQPHA